MNSFPTQAASVPSSSEHDQVTSGTGGDKLSSDPGQAQTAESEVSPHEFTFTSPKKRMLCGACVKPEGTTGQGLRVRFPVANPMPKVAKPARDVPEF